MNAASGGAIGGSLPAASVIVHVPDGLGVPSEPMKDHLGILSRRLRRWRAPGRQWFSRMGYYFGPFDHERALDKADEFLAKSYAPLQIPPIYLTVTELGLGILPAGRGFAIWIPYPTIATVTLHPATRAGMSVITPSSAHQLGRVSINMTSGKTAELGGTTVDTLAQFLQQLGARIA